MCLKNFYIISYFLFEEFAGVLSNIVNFRKTILVKVGNVKCRQFPRGIRAVMETEGSFLWHNHFYNFKELLSQKVKMLRNVYLSEIEQVLINFSNLVKFLHFWGHVVTSPIPLCNPHASVCPIVVLIRNLTTSFPFVPSWH
jgi:hypothetical protein